MNYRTKLEKIRIGQLLGGLVIQVHKEPEAIGLLLDDIKFLTGGDGLDIGREKLVRLLGWNGQDPTVHEDMGRRSLGDAPTIY
jgi:hypothetical protein